MKKRLVISVFSIQLVKIDEIMQKMQQHQKDIMETGFFDDVQIIGVNQQQDPETMAITLAPKSDDDWQAYNDGPREKMKEWFTKNLTKPGLVEILRSWISTIIME